MVKDTYRLSVDRDGIEAFSILVYWVYFQKVEDADGGHLQIYALANFNGLQFGFSLQMLSLDNILIGKLHEYLIEDNYSSLPRTIPILCTFPRLQYHNLLRV
jgi:hypothetical protein